ncbi:general odorant-binding protein 45-like [Aedes albopictus]|uniref:Uncharacterized protein n=1 Tax=Aedes albopictus TaxID=7160 RepID=A0ABM1Z469_AEDAL|nr:general odorant-binding protein 45-like [Aedes albopictus]
MEAKKWYIFLLFLTISNFASIASSLQHSATLKSFDKLSTECSQYLPSSSASYNVEDCSDRCLGLVGRFWNDTIGRTSNSVSRFYRPDSCDQDYVNRTLQCMCETVQSLPRNASCQRASCSMQCYRDQFGHLINREPRFVPVNELKTTQIFLECAQILQIPSEQLGQIFTDGCNKTAEGRCLMRCYLLRAGLYSDCRGPDIGRFSVQCQGYSKEYEQWVTKCYAGLRAQQLDSCTLATRVLDECIQGNEYSNSDQLVNFAGLVLTAYGLTMEGLYYGLVGILFS